MKNKLKYLGLIGLLGLLGIFTKNYGLFGFFGFFGFFGISIKSDERFYQNAYRSGFYAFVVGLIGVALLMSFQVSNLGLALMSISTAILFVAMIFTFIGCVHWFDRHGE